MRIRRIDLIRYGCFTGSHVDLPPSSPDMHIVVGPNESGKSTVLQALEDLLFGIPTRTPLNFRHAYKDMRLGAEIESNGNSVRFRRRKGVKNTVLSTDDTPLPGGQGVLSRHLGGTDRAFFSRVFSLDHARLREGGREILDAKGDLGEALFAAGSGVRRLSQLRRGLATRADGIWSKRRSAKREYYQAKDRLDAAARAKRQDSVGAQDWKRRRQEYKRCLAAVNGIQGDLESAEASLRKNSRIRRVARTIRAKARLEAEIRNLADVAGFPLDAREALDGAEQEVRIASRRAEDQREELERVTRERAGLDWDETVLLRAKDIERLNQRLIVARKGREDLPKREAELAVAKRRLLELGAELGWVHRTSSDLADRIPSRASVADARKILSELGKSSERVEDMERALREAENSYKEAERELAAIRVPPDVSKLSPLLAATREQFGDLGSRIHSAVSDVAEAQARAQQLAGELRPAAGSPEEAAGLALPTRGEVTLHRDSLVALQRDVSDCEKRIRDTELEITRREASRDRIENREQPVSRGQVIELRERRDAVWGLIRRKHIEGEAVPAAAVLALTGNGGGLAPAYERAVFAADRAVDRSVETASAAAKLEEAERAIEAARIDRDALRRELAGLKERWKALEGRWRRLWRSARFQPSRPEAMLAWLELHTELRQEVARQARRSDQLLALREQEARAVAAFVAEMSAIGVDPASVRGKGLRYVLEHVAGLQRNHDAAAHQRQQLERERDRAVARAATRREDLDAARSAEGKWRSKWTTVLIDLGLQAGLTPASAEMQFDVIDQMRSARGDIENLRHERIGKIREDIAEFEAGVSRIVSAIDPDLLGARPDEAVLGLAGTLAAARQASQAARLKDGRIRQIKTAIRGHENDVRRAREGITKLQALAGTEAIEELRSEIGRAERLREVRAALAAKIDVLGQDGDGRSVEDLEAECEGVDLDLAHGQEPRLREQIRDLRQKLEEARSGLRVAEGRYREVGGGDSGAIAESSRQSAIAEIREIAERYVRTRVSERLVGWAIDRYRKEKQAPMLRRAGDLFSDLTLGSFEALELDYDQHDRPRLVGRRPSDERVDVDGMSEGTVDQLYLALRVAALEDYLGRGRSLPFIADDLFINFDDSRSAAGLRILGALARQCQIVFFTHHDHLAELAESTLEGKVQVWRLE